MAKRIKVTGYLYPDDMAADEVDLDDPMGLSVKGHESYSMELAMLDDLDFVLEDAE